MLYTIRLNDILLEHFSEWKHQEISVYHDSPRSSGHSHSTLAPDDIRSLCFPSKPDNAGTSSEIEGHELQFQLERLRSRI